MKCITLSGWKVGMKKVSLTKFLQGNAGYSLARAKATTDAILNGESVTIEVPDEQLDAITAEIRDIGVDFVVNNFCSR
jgi:hypothetical protein